LDQHIREATFKRQCVVAGRITPLNGNRYRVCICKCLKLILEFNTKSVGLKHINH